MQYTCAIACYLLSGSTALYAVTSDESMTVTVTNQLGISAEKEREVRQSIARAPEVILSLDADVGVYVDETCKMIAGFPDPATRRRYYRAFIDRACTTCFEKIEEKCLHRCKAYGKLFLLQKNDYGSLVKGSRRRPLTAESWVRFPYELLQTVRDLWQFFSYLRNLTDE